MPKTKATIGIVGIVSALATLAIALPSSATAAGSWYVGGAKLTTTAALATTAALDSAIKLNEPAESISITCTNPLLVRHAAVIHPDDTALYVTHLYFGCSESAPVNCSVSSTIATEPLVGTLATSTSPEDRETVTPKTGKFIAAIEFKGEKCAAAGEKPLSGSYTTALPAGQVESTLQAVEYLGSKENSSLTLAGHPAFFQGGRALLKLASGSKWSFH